LDTLHIDVRDYCRAPTYNPNERPSTMREAAAFVAHKHGITKEELLGRSKRFCLDEPRAEFVTICRDELGKTLNQIGRMMGGRHHTTVLHYLSDKVKNIIECEKRNLDNMRKTLSAVAEEHLLLEEDIIGRERTPRLSEARRAFVIECTKLGIKYPEIGNFLGGRKRDTAKRYVTKRWGGGK
jgi:chromosomal replication initiation ATPase DnaA